MVPPAPRREVIGFELEIRPYDGIWSRFEGRVIKLVQASGSDKVWRDHHLPDHGPASNGRTFVTTRPYWLRSRSRERLESRLKDRLNAEQARRRALRAESIRLTDTMAGWQ